MGLKSKRKLGFLKGKGYAPCMGLKRVATTSTNNNSIYAPCMGLKSDAIDNIFIM